MIKLTVLYGQPDDPAAFDDYYKNSNQRAVSFSRLVNDHPHSFVVGSAS